MFLSLQKDIEQMESIDELIKGLKIHINEFLDKPLTDIKGIDTARDLIGKYLQYQVNLERLTLIKDPQYTVCSFNEKKSKNTYLQAKIYWVDENGDYGRILSKSLGNITNYQKGLNDQETKNIIKKKVSNYLFEKFISL